MTTTVNSIDKIFIQELEKILGKPQSPIPLHEPEFSGNEWTLLKNCLDSTFVSSIGEYTNQFEVMLTEYTGAKYAVAVVNGTAALHISLMLAGVKLGDEVLVPALSFVATANAVSHCGAIPHFVDSELNTMGMDPWALEEYLSKIGEVTSQGMINIKTGRRIAAIVPMHTYGHPMNIESLLNLAERYGLPVVEDAAESLGSTYQGRHTGNFGLIGILSFNGNKIITTGGGGAILTNNAELARQAKHLTTTAKKPHPWEILHDSVAWNYRLPNINAALGCAQMERLSLFLAKKRELAARYQRIFANGDQYTFVNEPQGCCSNYWLNTIRLNKPDISTRDDLIAKANAAGYQCRPAWGLLHKLPMYKDCPRSSLPIAERLEASLINLPSSPKLLSVT